MVTKKNQKINIIGVFFGLSLIGLALFSIYRLLPKSYYSSLLVISIGFMSFISIKIIEFSLKGISVSSILKKDIKEFYIGPPPLSVWKIAFFMIVGSLGVLYIHFSFKSSEINTIDNKIACAIRFNCVRAVDFESMTFKVYDEKSRNYIRDNYNFYFKHPSSWQVEYRKNNGLSVQNKIHWDFKVASLDLSSASIDFLPSKATMYLEIIYPAYFHIDSYVENTLLLGLGDVIIEERKAGGKEFYYFPQGTTNLEPHYVVLGRQANYRIGFKDTPKEVEDKIVKSLLVYQIENFR